jgi:mechanosensitive ion channel-like protein
VLYAALDIGNSVERGFDTFFAWIPALVGALVILVIGYIVAKVVGNLVARVLGRAGLDRQLLAGTAGDWVGRVTATPSRLVGTLVFWAIFLGAISLAATALGIEALTAFVASVYAYLPNVIAAVLIFLVAGAIAAGVSALASRFMGDTPTGRIVATAAPILVMTIATFMILDQLKIAQDIVIITYAALLGAIALASALAFGLGGREVAADMLRGAYSKGQAATDQAKRDIQLGKTRARSEVDTKTSEPQPATQVIAEQPTQVR